MARALVDLVVIISSCRNPDSTSPAQIQGEAHCLHWRIAEIVFFAKIRRMQASEHWPMLMILQSERIWIWNRSLGSYTSIEFVFDLRLCSFCL